MGPLEVRVLVLLENLRRGGTSVGREGRLFRSLLGLGVVFRDPLDRSRCPWLVRPRFLGMEGAREAVRLLEVLEVMSS